MSMDAIKQVTDTEAEAKERRAKPQAEAQTMVAGAEKAGREALAQARKEAQAGARELLSQAESQAEVKTREALAEYEKDCQALKARAAEKLDEAAALIVRRVVNT